MRNHTTVGMTTKGLDHFGGRILKQFGAVSAPFNKIKLLVTPVAYKYIIMAGFVHLSSKNGWINDSHVARPACSLKELL